MKEGWETKKLVDICKIQYGYPFDSKQFCDDSKYPQLIRIRDVSRGYSETYFSGEIPEGYYIDKGDYLIGMDGEFNIAAWNSERALLNQRVCKITANNEAFDRFLYYNLRIILKQIEDETPFVTVKHLSAKRLNGVTINLPPLSEQKYIVNELDLLSSIIEKKKAQIKELDNLAQSLFYEMFGDPITNEKGWEVRKLADISKEKLSYGSGASAIPYDGKMRYIRITDINDSGELNDNIVSPNSFNEKCLLNDGDILFARSGATVGKTYYHKEKNGKCIYAGYLIRLIPNADIVLPSYVFGYTKTQYYMEFVKSAQNAVAQPNINAKQYGNLDICIPPLSLQQQFTSKIEAIEQQKELIKKSIKEVETLFNSRMDYYFN